MRENSEVILLMYIELCLLADVPIETKYFAPGYSDEYFFVSNRLLWSDWEEFIGGK